MTEKKKEIYRSEVVQLAINKINAKRYMEIGVLDGSTFLLIEAPYKFAVDPFFQVTKRNKKNAWRRDSRNLRNKYFEMKSDDFFANKKNVTKKKFDVALIDGLHIYEQTLKDVENTLDCLNDNGVIVMHDCFPPFEAAAFPAPTLDAANKANPPGWTGEWCGDVWKVLVNLRSRRHDVNAFVLNTDKGLGIVTKATPDKELSYTIEEIDQMDYNDMMKDPEHYIGLKDVSYLDEFINGLKA